jgi:hypothetical protein
VSTQPLSWTQVGTLWQGCQAKRQRLSRGDCRARFVGGLTPPRGEIPSYKTPKVGVGRVPYLL